MFLPYKKIIAISAITGFTLLGILAAKPVQEEKSRYKNLKVLSKNISEEDMEWVMDSFNSGLGANCLFCHPGRQNGTEYIINYATDSLMNKRVARDMLRMTIKLNNKYFKTNISGLMNTRGRIWCKTCHQRKPVPMLPPSK